MGNTYAATTGTTYREILLRNLVTFINVTLVGIGILLIALGQFRDAVMTSSLAIIGAIIGIVQEVIAKRRLDEIALLNRVRPVVMRDGSEVDVDPSELVVGDIVVLRPGDQVPLDGVVTQSMRLKLDESLLTGESDSIEKEQGEELYSGSFCVSGSGSFEVTKVGSDSMAVRIAEGARARKVTLTPLQQRVNSIVRVLIAIAATLLIVLTVQAVVFWHASFRDVVTASAVVLGTVPPGLFLMITVTYSMAAVRLARENLLVQQTNAVESLSNVNVFCMDKTGTLTTNRLQVADMVPVGDVNRDDLVRWLGTFVRSVPGGSRTTEGIAEAYDGSPIEPASYVAFASAHRWSGMTSARPEIQGTFVLGAPENLLPALDGAEGEAPADWRTGGLRVMLFAHSDETSDLEILDDKPILPQGLRAVAWIALKDELRPNLQETMRNFREAGIELKVISGDNPETVKALATQAGFAPDAELISGLQLDALEPSDFDFVVRRTTIFGRISPHQKERIVDSLRRQGKYVAMTGDGVNDVLSLKKAHLGIAMESGSQATRAVADIVLLNDTFSPLPMAFKEGQRIQQGLQGTLELFLVRVFSVAIIMALTSVFRLSFPFLPGHMTLLTILTVGIPSFALAFFAPAQRLPRHPMRALIRFVAPAVVFVSSAAFLAYAMVYIFHDRSLPDLSAAEIYRRFLYADSDVLGRDALTYVMVLCGLWMVVFTAPPTRWFAVVESTVGDWRPTIVAALMLPLYALIVAVPPLRDFFGMNPLDGWTYLPIAVIVTGAMITLRYAWASGVVDRCLRWRPIARLLALIELRGRVEEAPQT